MSITIPERLQETLHADYVYESYIQRFLGNVEPLLSKDPYFFPEYTIHGVPHINAVLHHADKLIPDESMEVLTSRDAALLIASVIIHDMGMFMNVYGVQKLLTGNRSAKKSPWLDEYVWKNEWDGYIREIRRYPEEKLLYHFGVSRDIEEPDLTKGCFSDLDRLIVGEFLRRNHHRIAYEIAVDRVLGYEDVDIFSVGIDQMGNQAFREKDRKCIGVLAWSHGVAVRETKKYIKQEIGRQYLERMTYLMAVLRLADALDADENRAPNANFRMTGIRTPISVREWTWNQRITRTECDWQEGVDYKYIEADPKSTSEFIQLEKWIARLQGELDICWAVLLELCDIQKYRLSIHRIESDLLEPERREAYNRRFLTKEARLNANPELLKLLVAPLYDNDPSCGVRELLQNAVDACNERAHLEGSGYRGEVQIYLDTKAKTMTVIDNGIGMDENVLLNYYLSAGASYRTSEAWFEKFATGRDSNIVRTGRFGVGVLATFLLGNRVEVTTRHMEDDWGYTFEFGLEPKALDIKRPEVAPEIGTTIVVHLKEDALEKLREDYDNEQTWLNWYRFADPSVWYWVDDEKYVGDKPFIPQDDREMPGWFDIRKTELEMVRWGYPSDGFFCNGIRIPKGMDKFYEYADLKILSPSVSVCDRKNILKTDLSRNTIDSITELKRIEDESIRYTMAQLLMADWSTEAAVTERLRRGLYTIQSHMPGTFSPYICAEREYAVKYFPTMRSSVKMGHFLVFFLTEETEWSKVIPMIRRMKVKLPFIVYPKIINKLTDRSDTDIMCNPSDPGLNDIFSCPGGVTHIWFSRDIRELDIRCQFAHKFEIIREENNLVEMIPRNGENLETPFEWTEWDSKIIPVISERYIGPMSHMIASGMIASGKKRYPNFLSFYINEYFAADPWIPYDMEERRKKLPKAFEELKYYIDRIIADREKERGAQNA